MEKAETAAQPQAGADIGRVLTAEEAKECAGGRMPYTPYGDEIIGPRVKEKP